MALISGYDGNLDDVHIVAIGQIFDIPVAASGAFIYGDSVGPGPVESRNYLTQRTALFDAILVHKDNANVEAKVLGLVSEWERLPAAGFIKTPEGHEYSVASARASIRRRLFAIYPVQDTRTGADTITGR